MQNRFHFRKNDLEIEFSGEKEFVENQIKQWRNFLEENISKSNSLDLNQQDSFNSQSNQQNIIKIKKNITINDFFDLKKPGNDIDKTLVTAYYLEKYEKLENFTELNIAKIAPISNIEACLNTNETKGYISLLEHKNNLPVYTLTYAGEMRVREGL